MHYMQAGWRIIPLHRVGPDGKTCSCKEGGRCRSAGKHPKSEDWSKAQPMSAADVHATWDTKYAPNLGVVTGHPSGFWVLDIDPGAGGFESYRRLVNDNEKPPSTLRHKTGSGGFHLMFKMVDGFEPKTASNVLKAAGYPGIDVRGVGGQIVLPPSRSDKGDYTVAADVPIVEAPAWLIAMLPQVTDTVELELDDEDLAEYEGLDEYDRGVADRYVDAAVAGVVRDLEAVTRPWEEGAGWDQATHRAACRLFELAQQSWSKLTYVEAYQLLAGHAPQDSEWGATEINAKWNAAQNSVGKKPMPRPRGKRQEDDGWGFDEKVGQVITTTVPEAEPGKARAARRLHVEFDADDAFTEPEIDEKTGKPKGKPQFQPKNVAKSLGRSVPIAHGADGVTWAHADGRWSPHPELISDSLAATLGNAAKPSMIGEVQMALGPLAPMMVVGPTPEVINFRNGMLNWETMELGPHDPAAFSTIQLPHDWDPTAECPSFDQFLAESLPPEGVKLAWEIMAIALYSGNPIQRAVLLYGPPASGKSVFLDVIANLLGQENVSRVTLQGLSGRFNAAELYGRAANICADIDATKISETGAFKMIVAGDTVQGERKNKNPFTFRPFATQFFSANTIPGSDDRSGAWTRRFAVLHFPHPRPAELRVLDFSRVLLGEASGIIAKAVSILPDVLLRGEYSLIAADQADFEKKTNYLLQFLEDEIIAAGPKDPEAFVTTKDAQARYAMWCSEEGYEHPASWKKVTETLLQQGYQSTIRRLSGFGSQRGWAGFHLKPRNAPIDQLTDPYDDQA
jgi:P4 family phage/plasmid primase-like protien